MHFISAYDLCGALLPAGHKIQALDD